jgi:cytochrome c-type biogenesis protein CcmE
LCYDNSKAARQITSPLIDLVKPDVGRVKLLESHMGINAKFIVAGLMVVAAVTFLIVSSTGSTAHYFLTVEELRAMGNEAIARPVTISGVVLGDTLVYDPSKPRVLFTIAQVPADPEEVALAGGISAVLWTAMNDPNVPRLEVIYDDVKPDLLEEGAQAIIRGHLAQDGRFYADEILLKCPSRYQEGVADQARDS